MSPKKSRLGVLVSGRGSNLQAIIDSIESRQLTAEIVLVLSNIGDVQALDRCRKHNLEAVFLDPRSYSGKTEFDRAMIEHLRAKSVDLVCLAGFMRILGKEFIQAFEGRILNIHPSLLPAFPGLEAQKQALEYGVKFSGCTVHFVTEGVDSGPIILQSVVPVYDDDNPDSLSRRILDEEHRLYPRAIQLVIDNRLTLQGRKVLHTNQPRFPENLSTLK